MTASPIPATGWASGSAERWPGPPRRRRSWRRPPCRWVRRRGRSGAPRGPRSARRSTARRPGRPSTRPASGSAGARRSRPGTPGRPRHRRRRARSAGLRRWPCPSSRSGAARWPPAGPPPRPPSPGRRPRRPHPRSSRRRPGPAAAPRCSRAPRRRPAPAARRSGSPDWANSASHAISRATAAALNCSPACASGVSSVIPFWAAANSASACCTRVTVAGGSAGSSLGSSLGLRLRGRLPGSRRLSCGQRAPAPLRGPAPPRRRPPGR